MTGASSGLLGVVLAGGESRRFGRDKATATLGGQPMALRVGRTLEARVGRVGVVGRGSIPDEALPWPVRPDVRPGLGPAGGILTALDWAREVRARGAVVLACDLPLVPASLVGLLVGRLGPRRPVAPAGPGPLGSEPLCAAYPASALEAVERALAQGPIPAHEVLAGLDPDVVPLEEVESVCDPQWAFLNVNREEDMERARTLLRGAPG